MSKNISYTGLEIAVIGMSGRFPDAMNIKQFWENLKNGRESISFFSDKEMEEAGVSKELLDNDHFVKCKGGVVNDKEYFDAPFFKYLPAEAEILYPSTRMYMECVWEALEDAGYNPDTYNGVIGVYGGASSSFFWEALVEMAAIHNETGRFSTYILKSNEFLCSQTAYKLNLKGPAVFVQTACSTSLVAINTACRALLTGECQIAIAGGVSLSLMNKGYLYQQGMINSKDGHVRTFDQDASGTVSGEGAGVVVLKLLKKAIKDGDNIHAVIRGSAINNDGNEKPGYTAPGVNGQAKAILSALKMANTEPESITYVEAHGTATALGDVTEIAALKAAYNTEKNQYCAIGSVKTNIGHLDTAAGVAGFIKTILALKHKHIPPSLNYKKPNPQIDFSNSPFYVNDKLTEWKNKEFPLRAGVSSFGIGGTNAHVILEEAPSAELSATHRNWFLLSLSARSATALEKMTLNLVAYLKENKDQNLADICYTLQVGRKDFSYRRKIVCKTIDEAIEILSMPKSRQVYTNKSVENCKVVYVFSGLGSQYIDLCKGLYETEPLFKHELDTCFSLLEKIVQLDLKSILYPEKTGDLDPNKIQQIDIAQYILFITSYCLAKLLMAWGIKPASMIGYSFGEYVAACISGVFSLEDAIRLIQMRSKLISQTPTGMMLSIPMTAHEISPLLGKDIALAIDNGESCIISGADAAILAIEEGMKEKKIMCMRLNAKYAMHSQLMEPILKAYEEYVRSIPLNAPNIPFISNVTGDWITVDEAISPAYWASQLRHTVQFSKGLEKMMLEDNIKCIELGPGSDLCLMINRIFERKAITQKAINIIRPASITVADDKYLIHKLGLLWLQGVSINWENYYATQKRYRVSLPSYPFEKQRYWSLVDKYRAGVFQWENATQANQADCLYMPIWKRSYKAGIDNFVKDFPATVLIFQDEFGLSDSIIEHLNSKRSKIILIKAGRSYSKLNDTCFQIDPGAYSDYELLFNQLKKNNDIPDQIFHLFAISNNDEYILDDELLTTSQDRGYYSMLNIAKSLSALAIDKEISLTLISNEIFDVIGTEQLQPDKSTVLGPVKVIPQEFQNIRCRYIDISLPVNEIMKKKVVQQLLHEMGRDIDSNIIAIRGDYIWEPDYQKKPIASLDKKNTRLKEKGVYLITGGLGDIGLSLADFLVKEVSAQLVLVGRTALPHKSEWKKWLHNHGDENKISKTIIRLQEIEQKGGVALVFNVDISDSAELAKVVNAAEQKLGKINGIIHAATLPDGAMITVREKEKSLEIFKSKLYGTLALERIFDKSELDFVIYFSSISAILGGLGQVGYCAANIFLDAFAQYKSKRDNVYTVSINWDRWKDTGIAKIAEKMHKELTGSELDGGLNKTDALHHFNNILSFENIPQLVVAPINLSKAIEQSKRQVLDIHILESQKHKIVVSRPDLTNEYIPPGTPLEKELVKIWEDYFGLEKIGVTDNFFELGGDSLKGMALLRRMKKEIGFDAGIKLFFTMPTVKQIASEIYETSALIRKFDRSSKITI